MTRSQKLDTLIGLLAPNVESPLVEQDKWRLYRSLVNVREPGEASREYLTMQDNFLQSEIKSKGVTSIANLTPLCDHLYLWQGDITTLAVGAIVNAANSALLGCFMPCHNCIDNAIHTFAGVQLREACADIMHHQGHHEPTGNAKITSGYNLPADFVLHTVGPIVRGNVSDLERQQLARCYLSCLDLANENHINSIAFCCISTGEFCFPAEEAAEIAVASVLSWQQVNPTAKINIVFNVYEDSDYKIYDELLKRKASKVST